MSSLPAGGAWIEIVRSATNGVRVRVAPRRGSVDRNDIRDIDEVVDLGRSPQGERGSK